MKKKTLTYVAISSAAALSISLFVMLTSETYYKDKDFTWYSSFGAKEGNRLIRGNKIDKIKNDIFKLIYALNKSEKDPETFRTPANKEPTDPPKLKLRDIKEQVVNVEVINDEYLTQRMGSTGAEEFIAVATFTLTEYDNVKFVNFIFEGGDHAAPGLYSREHFLGTWEVEK